MDNTFIQNGEAKPSHENKESAMQGLTTIPTSVTLSAEQFERLYLTPMTRHQPALVKQVGNPTPLIFSIANLTSCSVWQGIGRIRYYHDSPFMLFDGLERGKWKWSCLRVSEQSKYH
ncbi:uncharacterized protein N7511_006087 [Penicillium nucicola]|uniref:uncharacterized protein n=1 Tax=Penicillium nucicola TaxID=1850975 RepID=UPI002544D8CA|nr:uncharacterized protein N7511_006087 [Penicillium nucicola]KAJ5757393.1 hypothetical protein N7511_006087 [Penicillium nucicola]